MKYIKRAIEDIILRNDKTFKSILITGARQVGKTETIKRIFSKRNYISFDDPYIEEQAQNNPNMFMTLNPPPVVLDEIQRLPNLFRYIKIECDKSSKKGLFCLSGSQPINLMQNSSESLAGRVGIIEMSPLSQREINKDTFNLPFVPNMNYIKKRKDLVKPYKNIWERIHKGGYPELQDKKLDWGSFFSSYIKTYLERDVRSITAVQNLNDFRRFMVAVAARTGQILNYANIADEIGKDQSTIKAWISILEATNIIYLLEPYSASVLKKVIKSPKIYFRDTGLAAYLTRWLTPQTLASGAMSGAFFETFVVNEILKSYSNSGVDYKLNVHYYRGRDKKIIKGAEKTVEKEREIDLIIEENGKLYPIEIKQSEKVVAKDSDAFMVLDKINNKKRDTGAIICMCQSCGMLRENVFMIPVWYI